MQASSNRSEPLCPLNVAQIMDYSLDLYKSNFVLLAAIAGLVEVPIQLAWLAATYYMRPLAQAAANSSNSDSAMSASFEIFALLCVASVPIACLALLSNGAVCYATVERRFNKPVTIAGAYRAAFKLTLLLLANTVLASVMVLVALFYCSIPIGFAVLIVAAVAAVAGKVGAAVGVLLIVLGTLLGLVLALGAATFIMLIIPATISERAILAAAIGRVAGLCKGTVLRTATVGSAVLLIVPLMQLALVEFMLLIIGLVSGGLLANRATSILVTGAVGIPATILLSPIRSVTMTVLYLDQRVRRDGLDMRMDADAYTAALEAPAPA